jgi:hypothetical protein
VDDGRVESSPPTTTHTPDGWTLTLSAKDETQLVIAPLTTAISSREYEVGGTYNGSLVGPEEDGPPEGTLEVGYQIGSGQHLQRRHAHRQCWRHPVAGPGRRRRRLTTA